MMTSSQKHIIERYYEAVWRDEEAYGYHDEYSIEDIIEDLKQLIECFSSNVEATKFLYQISNEKQLTVSDNKKCKYCDNNIEKDFRTFEVFHILLLHPDIDIEKHYSIEDK